MKKAVTAAVVAAALGMLSACGLKAPETTAVTKAAPAGETTAAPASSEAQSQGGEMGTEPEVVLVYAEVNPLDTIVGQTGQAFKEKVEELSGGKIKIDMHASGVMGAENDVLDGMLGGSGTVHISRISAFALTSYGAKKSTLLSIPYTFRDRDHYWAFVDSELSEEFLAESAGVGLKGLFYGEEGFRHFFTKNPVEKVEDLKGLKLRVSNDPVMNGMVNGLGASPTVISFNELYSALQTGVVDGAEQPIANYKSNAFPEVAPNLILDGHTIGAIQVVITDEAWGKLTPEQQDILMEAGRYAGQVNREISEAAEQKVLADLVAEGVNVVEVADKAPWQEACKDIISSSTADQAELYQQILDLGK